MKTISEIKEAIKNVGGFEYDWPMVWGEGGYETNGQGDWESLPEGSDEQEEAKAYEQDVLASIAEAAEYCKCALDAIEGGRLEIALEYLQSAASCEARYGDSPTYSELIDALERMMEEYPGEPKKTLTIHALRV